MIKPDRILFIFIIILVSGCYSMTGNNSTVTVQTGKTPEKTLPLPTATSLSKVQNDCLEKQDVWSFDSALDGTLVFGNPDDQRLYLLSAGYTMPQPLSGLDTTWDSSFHLSPNGKWITQSVLSEDGLSYATLRTRSLDGAQIWDDLYQPEWYSEGTWINNEYIQILKSVPEKSTNSPFTGVIIIDPFKNETAINMNFDTMNLKLAVTPYYDPTLTRMIYLRDDIIPEIGEPLFESIVIADIYSGKELWVKEYPGRDLFIAAWSPDGKKVAVQDASELIVVNIEQGSDKVLQRDDIPLDPSSFPRWSTDGRYVAVKTYNSLAVYDPISENLTDYCIKDRILNFYWSPSGRQLAVDGFLSDDSRFTFIINVDTKTGIRFSNHEFVLLGWTENIVK